MTREEFEALRNRVKASGETLKSVLKVEGIANKDTHMGHTNSQTIADIASKITETFLEFLGIGFHHTDYFDIVTQS